MEENPYKAVVNAIFDFPEKQFDVCQDDDKSTEYNGAQERDRTAFCAMRIVWLQHDILKHWLELDSHFIPSFVTSMHGAGCFPKESSSMDRLCHCRCQGLWPRHLCRCHYHESIRMKRNGKTLVGALAGYLFRHKLLHKRKYYRKLRNAFHRTINDMMIEAGSASFASTPVCRLSCSSASSCDASTVSSPITNTT